MSIKSKRWYENQIKVLENAAKNTARFIITPKCYEYGTKAYEKDMLEVQKYNSPIQAECKKIYNKLNELKDEYNLYYR